MQCFKDVCTAANFPHLDHCSNTRSCTVTLEGSLMKQNSVQLLITCSYMHENDSQVIAYDSAVTFGLERLQEKVARYVTFCLHLMKQSHHNECVYTHWQHWRIHAIKTVKLLSKQYQYQGPLPIYRTLNGDVFQSEDGLEKVPNRLLCHCLKSKNDNSKYYPMDDTHAEHLYGLNQNSTSDSRMWRWLISMSSVIHFGSSDNWDTLYHKAIMETLPHEHKRVIPYKRQWFHVQPNMSHNGLQQHAIYY